MDGVIDELMQRASQGGDTDALRRLIAELVSKGRADEIIKVIRYFSAAFPDKSSQVMEILQFLEPSLPPEVVKAAKAIVESVQKGDKPRPKPPPLRPGPRRRRVVNVPMSPRGIALLVGLVLLAIAAGLYLSRSDRREASGWPNCDCENKEYRIVGGPYLRQCQAAQANLRARTDGCGNDLNCIRSKLRITARPDRTLQYGELFCDSVTHGPRAWPLRDGPFDPPG